MNSEGGLARILRETVAFSWPSQAGQYPADGPCGVSYFRGDVSPGSYVDCLLYRDKKGVVVGILNRYPKDFPPYEKAGNINIFVRPDMLRQGIATMLLREALTRWHVNFEQQQCTPSGAAFLDAFIRADLKKGKRGWRRG
ncbi:GNAT family N-acetyltransferase [Amycolatopsis minnesotensis]|uniref:N-acetyltransferase domain-containing protein n=1 Tax=Amycolatopsis minnesotensis TaxID=337894 RepID=A0ABN2R0V5_9PSEU